MTREEWDAKQDCIARELRKDSPHPVALAAELFGPRPPEPFPVWGDSGILLRRPSLPTGAVRLLARDPDWEISAAEARALAAGLLAAADYSLTSRPK